MPVTKKNSVDSVLETLKTRSDDGLARLVYTGRALSKSDRNLHLCVSSGMVRIPIEEIESIAQVYKGFEENLVHVTVRNADRVSQALRREQLEDSGGSPAPASSGATDLSHWDHGTATDLMIHDACDATDVYVRPAFFESR